MSVHVAHDGPVCIVTIDRPEVRNAVDGPTAHLLAEAFRAFDADPTVAVAVLTGADGTFCAGADLKGIGEGRGNRVERHVAADGPMGPTRMLLSKPVIVPLGVLKRDGRKPCYPRGTEPPGAQSRRTNL